MRAGGGDQRRLVDRLVVPLGIDRAFAGEHDERHARARRGREDGADLGDAGTAGDGGDAGLAGRAVVAHRHADGAVLMPGVERLHAVDLRHRGRPMHVAVAHQVEHRVDAFAGEGLGEHLVDRQIAHGLLFSSFIATARIVMVNSKRGERGGPHYSARTAMGDGRGDDDLTAIRPGCKIGKISNIDFRTGR